MDMEMIWRMFDLCDQDMIYLLENSTLYFEDLMAYSKAISSLSLIHILKTNQFYFLFIQDCVACNDLKLWFIFDTIDGMFYTECTSKSQTYAVVIVKLFHSCKHSYFVSVCRFQTTFCGVEYNLRFHSRFGTRFHFDEKFNAYEL